eukprot:1950509-Amphidinium_carterae.1
MNWSTVNFASTIACACNAYNCKSNSWEEWETIALHILVPPLPHAAAALHYVIARSTFANKLTNGMKNNLNHSPTLHLKDVHGVSHKHINPETEPLNTRNKMRFVVAKGKMCRNGAAWQR